MKRERVFVGMSGGVDSSVAAARLLRRGYDVVGVFIKVWQPDFIHCDWERERLDAMRVAAHLGIPFLTMNAEEAYKKEVADYMIRAYGAGITPNPDVMCNEHVKFGAFYAWARERGADWIATGHYARIVHRNILSTLHKGVDDTKDQSYFLWRIPTESLSRTLFPIGDTTKTELRKEALKLGLPTALKPDSQGICFLGEIDMYTFLSQYISLTPGKVLLTDGTCVGTHRGAVLYTKGQRHGITYTGTQHEKPYYVVERDITTNTVIVSDIQHDATNTGALLTDLHMLGNGFKSSDTVHAVLRYHARPIRVQLGTYASINATLPVASEEPGEWVSGQSCVFYRGDECIGGGIIS